MQNELTFSPRRLSPFIFSSTQLNQQVQVKEVRSMKGKRRSKGEERREGTKGGADWSGWMELCR